MAFSPCILVSSTVIIPVAMHPFFIVFFLKEKTNPNNEVLISVSKPCNIGCAMPIIKHTYRGNSTDE